MALRLCAVAVVVLLALAVAGCEGALTLTGERTTQSQGEHLGNVGGEVDVRIGSANGTGTRDIEFGYSDAVVEVEVTLQVQEGSVTLEFLGEDDQVTLTLEARGGEEVSGTGTMVTDAFGEGEYRITANKARGVAYHISYWIR
jgi:hypothetical protein